MISDVRIRPARPNDYETFARVFPELGSGDPTPSRERWQSELAPTTWVAERGGAFAGYCFVQFLESVGYVRHLVVAPEARRTGVGRALMEAARSEFRARGLTHWCLNVKVDNVPAIRLYQSMGLAEAYRSIALRVPWALLERLPPDDPGIDARPLTEDSEAAVEQTFDLPRGLLADVRRKPGRVLVQLTDRASGAVLGMAVFDPAFPGAFPFHVTRASLAGQLLRALAPHADRRYDFLKLLVERSPSVVSLLVGAGAEVHLETVHLRGPL